MSEMQEKIAQRRSIWQHIKETGNLGRKYREWASKDIYGSHMDALRDTDDAIRGKMEQGWPNLEEAVREARRSFKRGDYPSAIFYANQVSHFASLVYPEVQKLIDLRDKEIEKFYFQNPEAVGAGRLGEMHEQLMAQQQQQQQQGQQGQQTQTRAAQELQQLLVEARIGGPLSGAREFFWDIGNVFSKRQKELGLLEKVYRNKMQAQKAAARELSGKSKSLAQFLERTLEQMGDYRASGDISSYIAAGQRLHERQQAFQNELAKLYQDHFAEFIGPMVGATAPPATGEAPPATGEAPPATGETPPPTEAPPATGETTPATEAPPAGGARPPVPPGPKPHVGEEEEGKQAAAADRIWQRFKVAYENNDRPLAGALLARYSQVCEDNGYLRNSVAALSLARELLDE